MLTHLSPNDVDRYVPAGTDTIPDRRFKHLPDAARWFGSGSNGFQAAQTIPGVAQYDASSRHCDQKAATGRL
jgi:hypothetical protein